MTGPNRVHISDLRGGARLAVDATAGVVDAVERMHRTIQLRRGPLGRPADSPTQGITGLVYRSIRGVTRVVGRGIDASLAPLLDALPEGRSSPRRDAIVSALNGVYGDYLVRTDNSLAIEMSLRRQGRRLDAASPLGAFDEMGGPAPTGKVLVLVHGLCMNDLQWTQEGYSHGEVMASELGYTPLHLRYNTGLHVGENGYCFAALLETLIEHWPRPVEELAIIGHSMGGLVARSACHYGGKRDHAWLKSLRKLVFLGTPHHGSPLERGGHGLDYLMDLSPYSAPLASLGKVRSAGIQDLRHGTITTGGHRFVRLPAGVNCYAAAATVGTRRGVLADRLIGDGLVPLDSALGRHSDRAMTLGFPRERQWIGYEMRHLELLYRPEVNKQLLNWLQEPV